MSDTHNLALTTNTSLPFRLPAPEADVVLHCGDLTEDGRIEDLQKAIQMIGSIEAELRLVIAGNHELSLDRQFYHAHEGLEEDHLQAIETMTGAFAGEHGVVFLSEGTHRFTLKNGFSFSIYASPYTPVSGSSAFQYESRLDRFNPPECTPPWAENIATPISSIPLVDIVMTHGPPRYILDESPDGRSAGCEHLRRAVCRVKPFLHCFGHIHNAYGAQRVDWDDQAIMNDFAALPKEFVGRKQSTRNGFSKLSPSSAEAFRYGKQTLFVNAAIVNEDGIPLNAPWIVDLDLPCSREGGISSAQE